MCEILFLQTLNHPDHVILQKKKVKGPLLQKTKSFLEKSLAQILTKLFCVLITFRKLGDNDSDKVYVRYNNR